ncbi:MAG: hypothetical protein ABUS47_00430 [Steroidobacter sp.]
MPHNKLYSQSKPLHINVAGRAIPVLLVTVCLLISGMSIYSGWPASRWARVARQQQRTPASTEQRLTCGGNCGSSIDGALKLPERASVKAQSSTGAPQQSESEGNSHFLVAAPLPLGKDATLFLYDNRDIHAPPSSPHEVRGQIVDWTNNAIANFDHTLSLQSLDHNGNVVPYIAVADKAGIWVVGSSIDFFGYDGETRRGTLDGFKPELTNVAEPPGMMKPIAIGLDDGSMLLLTRQRFDSSGKAYRILPDTVNEHHLAVNQLPYVPLLESGSAAIRLKDGRVMLIVGRHYSDRQNVFLYNPADNGWKFAGETDLYREEISLAILADGRVFVGGVSRDKQEGESVGNVPELWDPRTETWSALPPMPLSFHVNAQRSLTSSAAVMPDGSIVVAGGLHRYIMVLQRHDGAFASHWVVVGRTSSTRIGGIVQALGNGEVVVSGGLKDAPDCNCPAIMGSERIKWTPNNGNRDFSISMAFNDPAVAYHGASTFTAGGWARYSMLPYKIQTSAIAELIDNATGEISELPSLPDPVFHVKALWVDDDRIVLSAPLTDGRYYQGIDGNETRATPDSFTKGFLAIFSMKRRSWSVFRDRRIWKSELAGVVGNDAILVSPDAKTWAVSLDGFAMRALPRQISVRTYSINPTEDVTATHVTGGVSRVLNDGRVIVAGGLSQSNFVEAQDINCQFADCPLLDFARGPVKPSSRYEIYDPKSGIWKLSSTSRIGASDAVIENDGNVVKLEIGENSEGARDAVSVKNVNTNDVSESLIEVSSQDGLKWTSVPKPAELSECSGLYTCRLTSGMLPDDAGTVVFLVQQSSRSGIELFNLWMLNPDLSGWNFFGKELTRDDLMLPHLIPVATGTAVYGEYFNTDTVRLWTDGN